MLKEYLKNEKIGIRQIQNLAKSLEIKVSDIKRDRKYKRNLKKRILKNLE